MYHLLHQENLPDPGELEEHKSCFGTIRHLYPMSYLLSRANCWCCWSCRLSSTIISSLTLFRRTIPQLVARLTILKASFFSDKALARMVLTSLRACWVGFGTWNTFLKLRSWCPTFLILSELDDGTLANEGAGAEKFYWPCERFPPSNFY